MKLILKHRRVLEKNMSTLDNIFVLNGLITHCINSSEYLYCCFVDFTKTFDYVESDIL